MSPSLGESACSTINILIINTTCLAKSATFPQLLRALKANINLSWENQAEDTLSGGHWENGHLFGRVLPLGGLPLLTGTKVTFWTTERVRYLVGPYGFMCLCLHLTFQ